VCRSFAQAAANKGISAANNVIYVTILILCFYVDSIFCCSFLSCRFHFYSQQTQAPVVIPKAEVVRENKQRRTRKSKDIPPTTAVPEDKSDDCIIIEQPHRVKTAKPRSLTTSLTSRSAVVSCS
jgi:hypothetical protein